MRSYRYCHWRVPWTAVGRDLRKLTMRYAEVCRWESALAEPPDFVWGLPLVQHFRKNNRKSEHRTKLLNLLCAVLFYFVR